MSNKKSFGTAFKKFLGFGTVSEQEIKSLSIANQICDQKSDVKPKINEVNSNRNHIDAANNQNVVVVEPVNKEKKEETEVKNNQSKLIQLWEIYDAVWSEVKPTFSCLSVNHINPEAYVDYVSHVDGKLISMRSIQIMFHRNFNFNCLGCKCVNLVRGEPQLIPIHQREELMNYFRCPRDETQSKFQSQEEFLRPLNELQRKVCFENMAKDKPIPKWLSEEEMKQIKTLKQAEKKHLWGFQFNQLMKQLQLEPIKLINANLRHNTLVMEMDQEIVDPVSFDLSRDCNAGIYGTVAFHIPFWLDYSDTLAYVADIEAPDHAQVYMECLNKFKMNRIILRNKRLIGELKEWQNLDFVYRACSKTNIGGCYTSKIPLSLKLMSAKSSPSRFSKAGTLNLLNWNEESLSAMYLAVSRIPTLILELNDPPKALLVHAISLNPNLISQLKSKHLDQELVEFACNASSFNVFPSLPIHLITFPMIYVYARAHYALSSPSPSLENVASAFFLLEENEELKEEKEKNMNKIFTSIDEEEENNKSLLPLQNESFYNLLWKRHKSFCLDINRHDKNVERRRKRCFDGIEFFIHYPKHLKIFAAEELKEESFQMGLLSSSQSDEEIIRFIESPTDAVLKLYHSKHPYGFRFLPKPWDMHSVIQCAVHHCYEILDFVALGEKDLYGLVLEAATLSPKQPHLRFLLKKIVTTQLNFLNDPSRTFFVKSLLNEVPLLFYAFAKTPEINKEYENVVAQATIRNGQVKEMIDWNDSYEWSDENLAGFIRSYPGLVEGRNYLRGTFFKPLTDLPINNAVSFAIVEMIKKKAVQFKYVNSMFQNIAGLEVGVEVDPSNIQFVRNPTEKMQLIAIRNTPQNIKHISDPTEQVIVMAITMDPSCFDLVHRFPTLKCRERCDKLFKSLKKIL
jgi:hypothetical protein